MTGGGKLSYITGGGKMLDKDRLLLLPAQLLTTFRSPPPPVKIAVIQVRKNNTTTKRLPVSPEEQIWDFPPESNLDDDNAAATFYSPLNFRLFTKEFNKLMTSYSRPTELRLMRN